MKSRGLKSEIEIAQGPIRLPGNLTLPTDCRGVILFAHGSGSSRFSPRNVQVASALNQVGLGTLLFDLLSADESEDRQNVFDIPLLADRLMIATRWIEEDKRTSSLPLGYFGASTGAGAALWAAATLGKRIAAVVSRGGRPDLAIPRLTQVLAPTLLIVGGDDQPVIEMNEEALKFLSTGELVIIPGATHLFEETGALETVAELAQTWFLRFFKEARLQRAGKKTA